MKNIEFRIFGYLISVSANRIPKGWQGRLIKKANKILIAQGWNSPEYSQKISRIKAIRYIPNPYPVNDGRFFLSESRDTSSLTSAKLFVELYWNDGL